MKQLTVVASFFAVLLLSSSCSKKADLEIYNLRCENLCNPVGIDKTEPRFNWKIKSDNNGTEQTAFQLLVASDASILHEGRADLWDSGKVGSSSGIMIPYEGNSISAGLAAYWKVRVYDENGKVSPWSSTAKFSVGLLNENDWQASYIGFNTENDYRDCPQLYRSFDVEDTGSKYFLHVNSLGYHEVYLNGQKVGKGILTPAVSQFGKRSLVNTYDLSEQIKEGSNELILWLGSGWYTEGLFEIANNGPFVKAQLEKISADHREIILVTDDKWMGRTSGYTRHGNWQPHQFGGEILDGSRVKNDLSTENLDGRTWEPISVVSVPEHEVSPQMTELNEITDTITPRAIVQIAKDTFIIDMGQNLTGWFEMHFEGLQKSQEVLIEYFDDFNHRVKFSERSQYDKYIAAGEGPEVFINKFNYHAFRYLRISNMTEMPDMDSIRAYLVHTGYELASGFECSDPDLNEIHDMLFYTLRCLSLGGVLVDCPHIERLGYGGDGNASTVTAQTMFNMGQLYYNWLQAWSDVIREDGGMPHTAPCPHPAGGGPYWCGFIVTATWNTYLNYGDTLLLRKYYPVMKKWLEYVDKYTVDGLLKRWPDKDYRSWYLGDWATPEGVDQTAEASIDVVNNSFIVVCYDNMQKIARVLGETGDIKYYGSKEKQLKKKVHDTFFDGSNNTYATGTQIDLAFPLIAGVVPEKYVHDVTESLVYETEVNRNGHIACGLVGVPVLTEWAVKNQAVDLMYSILKKRNYPGYLYMIDKNATTTWEHWNGHRSRIHNCYNGVGQWFYQAIGGINPVENVPAYRKVRIEPQIPKGVTWAKTYKETPLGKLSFNWEINNGIMQMELEIPVGTDSEVVIPQNVKKYTLNGEEYELQNEGLDTVKIKSGNYQISYNSTLTD